MTRLTRFPVLLLLALSLLTLPGAASKPEIRAWKVIEKTVDGGDAEDLLKRTTKYLEDFPGGEYKLRAHRLAGEAAFELGEWRSARRHLESWLTLGGRDGLDEAKLLIALSVGEEGDREGGANQLRNVATTAEDPDVITRAARELVALHLFDGAWGRALDAQGVLLERKLFDPDKDMDDSRAALGAAKRARIDDGREWEDATWDELERLASTPLIAGLIAALALEDRKQLVDSPGTENARRVWAVRYPDHPLITWVPGAEQFAAEPEDTNPLAVGLLLPESGRYAAPGALARRGIDLALQAGIELGWPEVELHVVDTAGEADKAAAGVKSLVDDDKVIAILGPMISSSAPSVAEASADAVVPTIMMTQKPGLVSDSPFAFNAWMHPDDQVRSLVDHAMGRLGMTKFAIAYPDKESAGQLVATFWDEVEKAGGQIVAVESYPAESTDFRETGRKLKALWYTAAPPGEGDSALPWLGTRTKPQIANEPIVELEPGLDFQAVFVPDNYRRVSMLAPGFIFEEINLGGHIEKTEEKDYLPVTLLGGAALNHPDLVTRGGKYTEGTVMVDGFFLDSEAPAVQHFRTAYKAAYGSDPTILEATAYDATIYLIQLLSEGVTSRRELVRRLALSTPVQSVTGARGFNADGSMVHELLTLQVRKGTIVQVWPQDASEEDAPEDQQ